jgi:hypothetical protein
MPNRKARGLAKENGGMSFPRPVDVSPEAGGTHLKNLCGFCRSSVIAGTAMDVGG